MGRQLDIATKKDEDGYLSREALDLILADHTQFKSIYELIEWIEDGRRELLGDLYRLAKELRVNRYLLSSILLSRAFQAAYFDYLHKKAFQPDVLEEGMQLLARDFTNPKVSVRERLAIFRVLQELFGLTPTKRIEHKVDGAEGVQINIRLDARPEELSSGEDIIDVGEVASLVDEEDAT